MSRAVEQADEAFKRLVAKWDQLGPVLRILRDAQHTGLRAADYNNAGVGSGHADPTATTRLRRDDYKRLLDLLEEFIETSNAITQILAKHVEEHATDRKQDGQSVFASASARDSGEVAPATVTGAGARTTT